MSLLETLVLASYVFTAGGYVWTWVVYRLLTNHHASRLRELEKRVVDLESS